MDVPVHIAPPIVYGEVKSKSNPNAKTILFYNHYDVQPVEPIELWNVDPLSGKVEGNHVFGRGAPDDKGELITRVKAVEYCLKEFGDVPCNIKFIVEGEEEIGSTHLMEYLQFNTPIKSAMESYAKAGLLIPKIDLLFLSGPKKAFLSVEIGVNGLSRDAHSQTLAVLNQKIPLGSSSGY